MALWDDPSADILFSPWVLRSAWNKVCSWYRGGDWYDPAEFLVWKSDPWKHLADLAIQLRDGTYRPSPFPELPYPKKGHYTRHYVMPKVGDQVAFMVFLVLLGPFFEARMPNVSFGNRLYRPRALKPSQDAKDGNHKRWFRTPFSLSHSKLYDGFPSSYGLFRRLLQWIVNRAVLGSEVELGIDDLKTEDPDLLPYYEFLKDSRHGFDLAWARLDLRMAYPSVERVKLREVARSLMHDNPWSSAVDSRIPPFLQGSYSAWGRPEFPSLQSSSKAFKSWIERDRPFLPTHPWHYLASDPKAQGVRLRLVNQLMNMLDAVEYAPWAKPPTWESTCSMGPCADCEKEKISGCIEKMKDESSVWVGPHGTLPINCKDLLSEDGRFYGLPTGLAVSGWLLNIALTPVDETICDIISNLNKQNRHLFYLRFVDDAVILAQDTKDLEEVLNKVCAVLPDFCGPKLHLNIMKAKPSGVREYLTSVIEEGETSNRKSSKGTDLKHHLKRGDYLTRDNVELFTTSIVREISGLADETLEEKSGSAGVERLEQLMELATLEVEDFEVGNDARLSFAVNKIARAMWPKGHVVCEDRVLSEEAYLQRILLIAETALRKHPWRFRLWRPIIIIALRASRPFYEKDYGREWLLQSIIPLVSWTPPQNPESGTGGHSRLSNRSWETVYQDHYITESNGCSKEKMERLLAIRSQRCIERTSFHRAQFWRELSACIRALKNIEEHDGVANRVGGWLEHFTPESAKKVLCWLTKIQEFASPMYRNWDWEDNEKRFLWWWEAEALTHAALSAASLSLEDLYKLGPPRPGHFRSLKQHEVELLCEVLSRGLSAPKRRHLRDLLGNILQTDSALPEDIEPKPVNNYPGLWEYYYTTIRGNREFFESNSNSPPTLPRNGDPGLASFGSLGLWENLHDMIVQCGLHKFRCPSVPPGSTVLWDRFIRFQSYASIRRLLLAHGLRVNWSLFQDWFPTVEPVSEEHTSSCEIITDLSSASLHKAVYSLDDCSDEYPIPAKVPAVPVDPTLACKVVDSIECTSLSGIAIVSPPTVVMPSTEIEQFVSARKATLVSGSPRLLESAPNYWTTSVITLKPYHPAPHPLFLFPMLFFTGDREGDVKNLGYHWQKAATLLWMLDGGEHTLNSLLNAAPYQLPLNERDDLRSRFMLPNNVWMFVETALGSKGSEYSEVETSLDSAGVDEDIISIMFDSSGDWDVRPVADLKQPRNISDQLQIRLVQTASRPNWYHWLPSNDRKFFSFGQDSVGHMSEELAQRLLEARAANRLVKKKDGVHAVAPRQEDISMRDGVIMFPEWAAPPGHVPHFKQFCRETGIALLCGLLPRELPRAVPAIERIRASGLRCLVNEAVLLLPDVQSLSLGTSFDLPTKVYEFRIRKYCPNASEAGLLKALEQNLPDETRWKFAGGNRWLVFQYPGWGAFTVVICSDVLTVGEWRTLAGKIQHLFIPAFNKDIDLFDQLTWTRGYELYANAVCANHGSCGGSVVWSPKHGYGKEVFRVHGGNQGLSIVVTVPVKNLVEAQNTQLQESVHEETHKWLALANPGFGENRKDTFKTPAPQISKKDH